MVKLRLLFLSLVGCLGAVSLGAEAPVTPESPAVDERWVWDLTSLYENDAAWEADLARLPALADAIAAYEGRLGEGSAVFFEAMQAQTEMVRVLTRAWSYASLQRSTDIRDATNVERAQRIGLLFGQLGPKTSWVTPEVLSLGPATVERYLEEQPALADYRKGLIDTLRAAPHTLGAEAEQVLATVGPAMGNSRNVYDMLRTADIDWPEITLSTGETVTVDIQGYTRLRRLTHRDDRRAVFEAFWAVYDQFSRTYATTYFDDVQANVLMARVRNHESSLAREFFAENLPEAVYRTLIEEVHHGLPALHRYFKLRGRMLGILDQRYYDIYPSVVETRDAYPIEKAVEVFLESTRPLGEDYYARTKEGLAQRWMHVYPQPGKRSGAFMSGGVYDAHPFVFLNHQDDFETTSTLAHEWGHALHSWYSNDNQPITTARYSLFIAEIAAFVNELLLVRERQAHAATDENRLFYLGQELEQYRGAYFRQAKFAEFELRAHEAVESGQPLSAPRLNAIYGELLREFMGHDEGVVVIDEAYHREWAYIPHFYRNFYVYNYSTSMAGAAFFAEKIFSGDAAMRDAYLEVLKAGGEDDPHQILLNAGLDLASPTPYQAIPTRMHAIMDEMEAILDRQAEEGRITTSGAVVEGDDDTARGAE